MVSVYFSAFILKDIQSFKTNFLKFRLSTFHFSCLLVLGILSSHIFFSYVVSLSKDSPTIPHSGKIPKADNFKLVAIFCYY